MNKFLASLALGVCLLAPAGALKAQDHDHDHDHGAPAHQWNGGENTYWHQYLKEHHKKDHDWEKANKREQADYWKWRDQHHDSH